MNASIYLGEHVCAVQAAGATARLFEAGSPMKNFEQALASLAELRRGRWSARPSASVWMSGSLAPPFLMEGGLGLRSAREAMSVAQSIAASVARPAPGPTAESIHPGAARTAPELAIWLQPWQAGRRLLGVAISTELRDGMEALAHTHAVRLRGIAPWWMLALNSVVERRGTSAMVAVEDTDALTLLGLNRQKLTLAETFVRPDTEPQLHALIKRATIQAEPCTAQVLVSRLELQAGGDALPSRPFGGVEQAFP